MDAKSSIQEKKFALLNVAPTANYKDLGYVIGQVRYWSRIVLIVMCGLCKLRK
ncbi:uncharacterized protein SPAPADRAFT_59454 [Spathaspora passalidarum NRRL Y-27907]|uniref:Uncharacterized protein n=1 Tax=Spathaspora passalidarum (strain NRRL Y-27907 / 11-Y1) TaxID=619300 RepID=G3AJY3_SPAPN|nr:uncharacterized protein SPAPADRAFT_59454 [Spathaspora passalidarum NRRL Y-27907]EGW34034.1 hypothetical protein SPAPADRAFT_59454 [Spathaspora passalidarum NRRL Y-27907]